MLGTPHLRFDTISSTNQEARDRVRSGATEGTLITARHQTAGRGRLDRRWTDSPDQSVLASYILYPARHPEEWGGLPLLAGLAVRDAVSEWITTPVTLKWPNDVLVEGKKLCGILVESGRLGDRGWVVLGIGINVRQRGFEGEYRIPPTSLLLESGRHADVDDVLSAVTRALSAMYAQWAQEGNAWMIDEWKKVSGMIPSDITLEEEGGHRRVRAVDIGTDGSLIVENAQGTRESVFAGDIALRPAQGGSRI